VAAAYLEIEGHLPALLDPPVELRPVAWRADLPPNELDRCAFALQNSSQTDGAWAQRIPTVAWPPLLVVAPHRPSVEHLERARRQGASLVVTAQDLPGLFAHPSGQALLRSGDWFQASLKTLSAADALQMASMNQRSGVLTVTCAHAPPVAPAPWSAGAGGCVEGPSCRGFIGRVILERGQVLHAETPHARGVDALSSMMAVPAGQVRLHEVFVRPAVRTLRGSTAQILISAAAREDERRQGRGVVTEDLLPDAAGSTPPTSVEALDESATDPGGVRAPTVPGVEQSALVDAAGQIVVASPGVDDALGPAAAQCARAFGEASERLGLGEVKSWLRLGEDAFFGVRVGERLAIGRGAGVKRAFRRLEDFQAALEEERS
jgi:hypothetical protein